MPVSAEMQNKMPAPALRPTCGNAGWRAIESSHLAQFSVLLAFCVLIRSPIYGVWNYDIDDQFYYLIGQRLRHGETLYIDIWDRKGPALYLLYAAIGAITTSPLGYQLAATFSAALGGFGVTRIARLLTRPGAALMGGAAYSALLCQFGGENGQAPVFYNSLVIAGAWAIASRLNLLRCGRIDGSVIAGVVAAGLAVMFKQSAAIEAAFFGFVIAALLIRSGRSHGRVAATIALLALLGTLPTLATLALYYAEGHFGALWQALVTSNLDRSYYSVGERLWYLLVLGGRLALPLTFAVIGAVEFARAPKGDAQPMDVFRFVVLWTLAATVAVIGFPAVFVHYALTLLAPLCILAALFFARSSTGMIAGCILIVTALILGGMPDRLRYFRALRAADALESYVRDQSPNRRVFVWGVPSALYTRLDSRPPSPLLFAPHFYEESESHATGHDPVVELHRILDWRPEAVVVQDPLAMLDANLKTIAVLKGYLRTCHKVRRFDLADHLGPQVQWVYSGCTGACPSPTPRVAVPGLPATRSGSARSLKLA